MPVHADVKDLLEKLELVLDEEEFDMFVQYHLSTCERADLMGASAHTVDILRV